jgi:hypothetical protein
MTTQYLVYDGGTCLGLFVIDDAAADHLRSLGFRLEAGEYRSCGDAGGILIRIIAPDDLETGD